MGRGGGSSGGHSGGGFGGSHNSGGFSGGGRGSSGGFSGGNNFGGFGGRNNHYGPPRRTPPPPGPAPVYFGGGRRRRSYRRGGSMTGCGTTVIILIIIIAVAVVFSTLSYSSAGSGVPSNTTERTPLSGQVNKTDWYEDGIGWVSSPSVMIKGLESFYNETGVQPFVLFVKYDESYWNDDGTVNPTRANTYLENVYAEKFTDEAHFIFAYFQCKNDSRDEMDGEFRYLSGYQADTIMDSEAIDIFWGFFKINYDDLSLSMEEMIADTFSQTGERIMSRPTNGWDVAKVVIIVVCVIAVAVIIFLIIRNNNKRKKEEAEEKERILNTPLETFGDDTSDLEDKYKD